MTWGVRILDEMALVSLLWSRSDSLLWIKLAPILHTILLITVMESYYTVFQLIKLISCNCKMQGDEVQSEQK
jgi:hypothetical protein